MCAGVLASGMVFAQQGAQNESEKEFQESNPPGEDRPVFVIPIQGEIDRSLMVYVRRGILKAKAENASHIIFDIDTFGGRVDSALQITTLIGSLSDITTSAYVALKPEGTAVSWSAGALISFSCDLIYMAPGTSMGAAAPVIMSPEGGAAAADEKSVSAIRVQMAALAEKNGYPQAIALAMVDKDTEVLEAWVDGELQVLTREDFEDLKRTAEKEGKTVEEGKIVSQKGKLLSLTSGEMEKYKVSSGSPESLEELKQSLGISGKRIVQLEPTGADAAVSLLTGAAFTSLLLTIGMITLFIEITSPGFGIPGSIAVLCFGILFASNSLLGNVGSVELILFVLGIALLIVEIFLIPGFGVTGIAGIALMASALVFSMQDFVIPTFSWEWRSFNRNILIVISNIIAGFAVFGVLAMAIPRFTPFRRLSLSVSEDKSEGYTVQGEEEANTLLGKNGIAVTTLRPSGKAEIDGEVIQVETAGEYIEKETEITVAAVNGNRIVVRRKK